MNMNISTTSWSLIGIAIAIALAGATLYYQGRALQRPSDRKKLGRQLVRLGWTWVGIAIIYLILIFVFKPA